MNKEIEKYTLFLGLNDKNTKLQEISTLNAYKIVQNLVSELIGGATISECQGIFTHEGGAVVVETSLKIEILFTSRRKVTLLANRLKVLFNQESIALQYDVVNSELV